MTLSTEAGISFPTPEQMLVTLTWRPALAEQAESRIWRSGRKTHKKRRNQTEAYHKRIQKKWDKRWKEQLSQRAPTVHVLYPHQEKVIQDLLSRKSAVVSWPGRTGKATVMRTAKELSDGKC